jgi:3'-phosphoadenosine 5'-phosphosulfate sulfotransferase (PAPS reductase)/FAD synthetase
MLGKVDKDAILAKVAGRKVLASVSGGKDSTAMCLYLKELGIPYEAVTMDTGWEEGDTYNFLDNVLPGHIGPITKLRYGGRERGHLEGLQKRYGEEFGAQLDAKAAEIEAMLGVDWSPMVRLCIFKGMFPSRQIRWCTQYLKVDVIKDYIKEQDEDCINAVGIRAAESLARSKYPEWEWNDTYDTDIWRPLIHWEEQDVVDIHKRHGVPPNPLYLKGSARVGCWPCIFARKAEIRMIGEMDSGRITAMKLLEETVQELAAWRYAKQGTSFEAEGRTPPTWFQSRESHRDPETGELRANGECWPIDRVLKWARTKRGGRTEEHFSQMPYEGGCMRWGLCDTSWMDNKRTTTLDLFGAAEPDDELAGLEELDEDGSCE